MNKLIWHQEKRKIKELAWLGGIIDGEGSVGITKMIDKRANRNVCYRASFQLTNTNKKIIDEVVRILKKEKILFCFFERKVKNPKHKNYWYICISKTSEVLKLAILIQPFLIGKKQQVNEVIRFCKRKLKTKKRGSNGCFIEVIDKKSEKTVERLKPLNTKGKWKK